jgi:protein-S-isoprenylcysteine O-methyltransferase Ste14
VQIGGGVLIVAGTAIVAWAMAINPFFSAVVRIQSDRGHRVIERGPYQVVRHPGYTGMLLVMIGTPLLLGTLWAFVPAALLLSVLVARTALEDRTLREELEGYDQYRHRVRHRLVPHVW